MTVVVFVVDAFMVRWHPLARYFHKVKSQRIASEIRDLTHFATFDVRTGKLFVRVLSTKDIPDQHLKEGHRYKIKLKIAGSRRGGREWKRECKEICTLRNDGELPFWNTGTMVDAVGYHDRVSVELLWRGGSGGFHRLGTAKFKLSALLKETTERDEKHISSLDDPGFVVRREIRLTTKEARFTDRSEQLVLAGRERKVVENKASIRVVVKYLVNRLGANIAYFKAVGETQAANSFELINNDLLRIMLRLDKLDGGTRRRGRSRRRGGGGRRGLDATDAKDASPFSPKSPLRVTPGVGMDETPPRITGVGLGRITDDNDGNTATGRRQTDQSRPLSHPITETRPLGNYTSSSSSSEEALPAAAAGDIQLRVRKQQQQQRRSIGGRLRPRSELGAYASSSDTSE